MPDTGLATEICARYGNRPDALIEILHDVQEAKGFVPEADLKPIAEALNLSRAEVWGTMSFYHDFRREPAGQHVVKLCRAEACQAVGALELIDGVCAAQGIELGGTSAGGVTVEPVYCLGNCALGPSAMVNDRLMGRATPDKIAGALDDA